MEKYYAVLGNIIIGSFDSCELQHPRGHCYNCEDDRDYTGVWLPITFDSSHDRIRRLLRSKALREHELNACHGYYGHYDEVIAIVRDLHWVHDYSVDLIEGFNDAGESVAAIQFIHNSDPKEE